MNPKATVIIPVYNMEKYLRECLDSVVEQSFRDIEIICFNDASTDNSLSILEEYAAKDSRIEVIDSKVNIKQGGGRNAGIRKASTDYVIFVDADDKISPSLVDTLYNTMLETKADIVISELYNWRSNETPGSFPAHQERNYTELTKYQSVMRGGVYYRNTI